MVRVRDTIRSRTKNCRAVHRQARTPCPPLSFNHSRPSQSVVNLRARLGHHVERRRKQRNRGRIRASSTVLLLPSSIIANNLHAASIDRESRPSETYYLLAREQTRHVIIWHHHNTTASVLQSVHQSEGIAAVPASLTSTSNSNASCHTY